jgi:large subunit ribosomal protein L17
MLHGNKKKQLGKEKNGRNALLKSLLVSFIKHGKITTTETKAKVIKPLIEKLITKGKDDSVASRRIIASRVGPTSAGKIVKEISPKYKTRNGGYTRITKIRTRLSDGARMAQIELV